MKNKSLFKNSVMNMIKTSLSLIVPLITYPYVSQVLGVTNIGKVNYINSIVTYFVLFSALGISTYATREGAKIRDKKEELQKFASEVFTINVVMTLLVYVISIGMLFVFWGQWDYVHIFLIQSLLIVTNTIGIEWMNIIFEDYTYITVRSIIINILSIILTFTLVKTSSDYIAYAWITVLSNFVIAVLNWVHCRKYVHLTLTRKMRFSTHIKPMIIFFANKLAINVYVNADTIMLGMFSGDYAVGIYSSAVKIYTVIKTMLQATYTTLIPRMSYNVENKSGEVFDSMFTASLSVASLLLFPACIGLLVLSRPIVNILFSSEFASASVPLMILSIALFFAIYGGIITMLYLVPKGFENILFKSTVISAVANCILNVILIPVWKENAAALTTLISEFLVVLYCFVKCPQIKEHIIWKQMRPSLIHGMAGSCIVICIHLILLVFHFNDILTIIITIVCSILLYAGFLLLTKDSFASYALGILKTKFHH